MRWGLGVVLAMTVAGSANADRMQVGSCSVSAYFQKFEADDSDAGRIFNAPGCNAWLVSTTCKEKMDFDYRVAIGGGETRVRSGSVSPGERRKYCGTGDDVFFVK
jgi:hypothetical protein